VVADGRITDVEQGAPPGDDDLIVRAAGPERVALVSDAFMAADTPPGAYPLVAGEIVWRSAGEG